MHRDRWITVSRKHVVDDKGGLSDLVVRRFWPFLTVDVVDGREVDGEVVSQYFDDDGHRDDDDESDGIGSSMELKYRRSFRMIVYDGEYRRWRWWWEWGRRFDFLDLFGLVVDLIQVEVVERG